MKQHADVRRALAERLNALLERTSALHLSPRPYQVEMLTTTRDWLEDPGGTRRAYAEQATGIGKTAEFASIISFCAGLRVLVVEPSLMLVEQTILAIHPFVGGMIGYLASIKGDGMKNDDGQTIARYGYRHCDVMVTTDESFVAHASSLANEYQPDLIIFDECHWGLTDRCQFALQRFPEAVVIGFSATPNYLSASSNGKSVPYRLDNGQIFFASPDRLAETHFQTLLDRRSIEWGVENDWLAPFAWSQMPIEADLSRLNMANTVDGGWDYRPNDLAKYLWEERLALVASVSKLYGDNLYGITGRQSVAFCPSVQLAEMLAELVTKQFGIKAASISNKTSRGDRAKAFKGFKDGSVRLLTSVMVLREGWDAPNAEICFMVRPTQSYLVYIQTMGRVLRKFNGKVPLILDGVFSNKGRGYQTLSAPWLFSRNGGKVVPGGLLLRPTGSEVVSPYLSA